MVSVIIPNWNGKELVKECLDSLQAQQYKNFETIVVDNGSTDGSIELISTTYPKVKIIPLDKNYGFAKAINEGVKKSKSKYIFLLNNDTSVDSGCIYNLIKTAQTHPRVASVGCKLLNYFKRDIIDGVGILISEVGHGQSIGYREKDNGRFNSEEFVFGVTGGAALFNRGVFISVGFFDEDYFMYYEEVDWAFRAQFLGYKSIYCPGAIVYHKHKMSSKKRPQFVEYWQFRNMTQTIIKDFPTEIILRDWRWLKIMLVHFNTIFYQLRSGFIWPPFAADIWIILHLPKILKKRRQVQSMRKVSVNYIESFLEKKHIRLWGIFK